MGARNLAKVAFVGLLTAGTAAAKDREVVVDPVALFTHCEVPEIEGVRRDIVYVEKVANDLGVRLSEAANIDADERERIRKQHMKELLSQVEQMLTSEIRAAEGFLATTRGRDLFSEVDLKEGMDDLLFIDLYLKGINDMIGTMDEFGTREFPEEDVRQMLMDQAFADQEHQVSCPDNVVVYVSEEQEFPGPKFNLENRERDPKGYAWLHSNKKKEDIDKGDVPDPLTGAILIEEYNKRQVALEDASARASASIKKAKADLAK